MLAPAPKPTRPVSLRFAFAFAWRELRGGLRGFGVFIACIALGVMAIAGVGSVAASLNDGIGSAGRVILGGDLAFALIQRQASDAERAFLDAHGKVSVAATLRAMARTRPPFPPPHAGEGREGATLVEVKAVDANYPLFGAIVTEPAMPLAALFAQNGGAFGAAVDPALLARLDLKTGDRINIGNALIELRAALTNEPDKLAGGIGLGPRVLISEAALRATGLLQPGSLVRWQYRLRLPESNSSDDAVTAIEKQAQTQFPQAGWEIRTRSKASPALERNVERFSQFLTVVGLTTLLVGGVGVANAVASHLARKRDVIATMKALGATGGGVFTVYCGEIVAVALLATLLGAALGAALPFAIVSAFGTIIPLAGSAGAASARTGAGDRLWPPDRTRLCAVAARSRARHLGSRCCSATRSPRSGAWPRPRYIIATAAIVAASCYARSRDDLRPPRRDVLCRRRRRRLSAAAARSRS